MKSHAWQEVPRSKVERFASIALAEAPEIAQKILTEIRQDYPYLQLVEDESGEPMALVGIRRAIEGFVRHLASGAADPRVPPEVFQEFGRGEGLHGRSLDSLQAVYRLGVRLTWRRFAEIGQQVDIAAPPCTSWPNPASSIWTASWNSRSWATPRRRPAAPASGCASSAS